LAEVNLFLLPLISATESASKRKLFFGGIGWNLEAISGFPVEELEIILTDIAREYGKFVEAIKDLSDDINLENFLDFLSSVVKIIGHVGTLNTLLDEAERPEDFADISDDVISYLIGQYLQATKPGFYRLLSAVALIDPPENGLPNSPVIFGEGESLRIVRDRYQISVPRFRFIKDLFSNPHTYLAEAYRILTTLDLTPEERDELSSEDRIRRISNRLFPQLGQLLEILGFNYTYGVALKGTPEKRTINFGEFGNNLIAGMLSLFIRPDVNQRAFRIAFALDAATDRDLGLVIIPFNDSFSHTTERWRFNIYTAEGLEAIALGSSGLTLEPSTIEPSTDGFIGTAVTRLPNDEGLAFQLGDASGSRLEIDAFSLGANIINAPNNDNYEIVINLGATTFAIDSFAQLSWDSCRIIVKPSNIVQYKVKNLKIFTPLLPQIQVQGDAELQFTNGNLDIGESVFYRYEPDFKNRVKIGVQNFYLDTKCIAIQIKDSQINYWLSQLIPGGSKRGNSVDNSAVLRLVFGSKIRNFLNSVFDSSSSSVEQDSLLIEEIRLDWRTEESKPTFTTPIFNLEFLESSQLFYSLIARGNNLSEIILTASFDVSQPTKVLVISSSFAWKSAQGEVDRDRPDRELQNDDDNSGIDLFELTFKAKRAVSLALLKIDLERGGLPDLLQTIKPESRPALLPFVSPTLELSVDNIKDKSNLLLSSLSDDDWELIFKFNLENFAFPFLKDLGEIGQSIEIKLKEEPAVDLANSKIGLTVVFIIKIGSLVLNSETNLDLNLKTFSLEVNFDQGIKLYGAEETLLPSTPSTEHLGLTWRFNGSPITAPDGSTKYHFFTLVTKSYNYKLIQAPDSEFEVGYGQISEEPITFSISNFELSENGISLDASVTDTPAKLNGIDTKFRFSNSGFSIKDNVITHFTLQGTGPLPPDLVGEAMVDVALQFTQRNGQLELEAGSAELVGNKLLDCKDTRFQFSIDAIALKFVFDRKFHLYFTLTGSAKFVLQPSDDSNSPLALLSVIEIELIDCPLTGDARVISQHVKFLIELPKPISFNFFGCFEMELRGIGFVPQAQVFGGDGAMQLTGQIKFAQGAGDTPSDKYDFHQIFVGLPEPGQLVPRLYLTELPINLNMGSAFKLNGVVGFVEEDNRQGFYGEGVLEIQGLPPFAASFEFLRVRRDENSVWLRAWFLYLEVRQVSFKIPIVEVFLREVGLGFGYRFTLVSIGAAARAGNINQLIGDLKKLSRTQGDLSKRDRWSVDLEERGEDPRWTIVLRAMIAQTSAATTPTDWNPNKEKILPCLFLFDAVLALRSDLTFFMAVRGWLNTNYHDYVTSTNSQSKSVQIKNKPLFSGFVLLSPRQKRLLAHVATNPEGYLGDRPRLGPFLESAIRNGRFSATLLVEPGLLHTELGWPNMLRWGESFKGLNVEIRGGAIFRVSKQNLVIGTNLVARGSLEISAKKGGSVGAKISARADVAYGTRYIGVVNFDNPAVYYYGGIGLEVQIRIAVEFWIRIKIWRKKITKRWRFSLDILFTAALEYGFYFDGNVNAGLRGRSTISVKCMGRRIGLSVNLGVNEGAVTRSRRETERFLNIGLEARDTDRALPVPGTGTVSTNRLANSSTRSFSAPTGSSIASTSLDSADTVSGSDTVLLSAVDLAGSPDTPLDSGSASSSANTSSAELFPSSDNSTSETLTFHVPNYDIFVIRNADDVTGWNYFLLYPCGETYSQTEGFQEELGFLPVPPEQEASNDPNLIDYRLTMPISREEFRDTESGNLELQHYLPNQNNWANVALPQLDDNERDGGDQKVLAVLEWKANWNQAIETFEDLDEIPGAIDPNDSTTLEPTLGEIKLREYLGYAFITDDDDHPKSDPKPLGLQEYRDSENSDDRVQNPTENSYESAVLGAVEQFRGSPLFKRDPNYTYEQLLSESFSEKSTIYDDSGAQPKEDSPELEKKQQAHELRGIIIQDMIADLQEYATTESIAQTGVERSLAFQMGLVFRYKGNPPRWLREAVPIKGLTPEQIRLQIPTLKQRNNPSKAALNPDLNSVNVHIFNTEQTNFRTAPPQFQNVKQYSNSDCIGITWDLTWDNPSLNANNLRPTQLDPEHHLQHYQVRRRALDGNEPEVVNTVQPAATVTKGSFKFGEAAFNTLVRLRGQGALSSEQFSALNTQKFVSSDRYLDAINTILRQIRRQGPLTESERDEILKASRENNSLLKQIKPRFQVFDRFTQESNTNLAALPAEGLSYLYSITPIDYSGNAGKPLTLIATRYPDDPPRVPIDGQLTIEYDLDQISESPREEVLEIPSVVSPQKIEVSWSDPDFGSSERRVPVKNYYLVFRKQKTLPIGSYGLDSNTQVSPTNALPTANGRPLPTDIKVNLERESRGSNKLGFKAEIVLKKLEDKRIFPSDQSAQWRPESWRVFFQTQSDNGVFSALAPVQLVLRFKSKTKNDRDEEIENTEEKQPAELEWLPYPMQLPILSPEDLKGQSGEAHVPVPVLSSALPESFRFDPTLSNIKFKPHPNTIRCIRFRWNRGNSAQPKYPLDLIARYHLLQLDIDAHTQDTFNDRIKLARVLQDLQEIQMSPPEDLLATPSDTLTPNQWEAWYPSTIARQIPPEQKIPGAETPLGTWYSWRDSVLEWPQWKAVIEQGRREQQLHPFLEQLIADLESPERFEQEYAVTRQISPPIQPTSFKDFRESTAATVDPYGWGILQRLGLSVTLSLRTETTNELVPAATLLDRINELLKDYQKDSQQEDSQWKLCSHHLHVTLLCQPSRSIELTKESAFGPDRLLSFVQVSLRPQIRQISQYYKIDLVGPSGAEFDVVFDRKQTFSLIDQSNPALGQLEQEGLTQTDPLPVPVTLPPLSVPVKLPANGRTTLLLRVLVTSSVPKFEIRFNFSADVDLEQDNGLTEYFQFENSDENKRKVIIQSKFLDADDATRKDQLIALWNVLGLLDQQSYQFDRQNILSFKFTTQPLSITQDLDENGKQLGRSAYFTVSTSAVQAVLEEKPEGADPQPEGTDPPPNQWQVFQKYLVALDPKLGQDFPETIPDPTKNPLLSEYLAWAQRFMDYSGLVEEVEEVANPGDDTTELTPGLTRPGPWLITAYPRVGTPAFVTPDAGGRLTYDHLLEDQWAHNYRYYIRPYSRYDLLWQSLLRSPILFPKEGVSGSANPDVLIKLAEYVGEATPDPDAGGLDVVLDRTKPIDKPLVLSSQRLDPPSLPENPALPGSIWEVIVAQHPEQRLSSKNRTLYNQLSYRRIAFTLLRQFAYSSWVEEQIPALFKIDTEEFKNNLIQVQNVFPSVPNSYPAQPDHINDWDTLDADTDLSLDLPKRLGRLQQGALVLQWEGIPFYYRLLLWLVAQTSQKVSPPNSVVQQDFEYRSPEPIAIQGGEEMEWASTYPYGDLKNDGSEPKSASIEIRHRRVKIALSRFWDCLPDSAQTRWRSENPDAVFVTIVPPEPATVRPTSDDLPENLQTQLTIENEKLTWQAPSEEQQTLPPSEEQQTALLALANDPRFTDQAFKDGIVQLTNDAVKVLSQANQYKLSELPDPDVVYQVVLKFSGNLEVQAEYYLNQDVDTAEPENSKAQYRFRQLGQTFQAAVLGVNLPNPDFKYFSLDTTLLQLTEFELRRPYDPDNFPSATISPTRYKINFSKQPFYSLVGVFTKQDRDTILTSLLSQENNRTIFQSLLDQGLTEEALTEKSLLDRGLTPEGLTELSNDDSDRQLLFQDYQTLDRLYRDWFSQGYVSQLPADGELESLVDFPEPTEWQLVWKGALSDQQDASAQDKEAIRQALLSLDGDLPFKRAIQRLVARIPELNADTEEEEKERIQNTITIESVPLPPQPAKVPGDLASQLENLEASTLTWNGLLFDSQVNRLRLWANLPELSVAVEAIVAQLDNLVVKRSDLPPPRPLRNELPDLLQTNLELEADSLSWTGLAPTPEQLEALKALTGDTGDNSFISARNALVAAVEEDISVALVDDPAGNTRPDSGDLPATLQNRLEIGTDVLSWVAPPPSAEQRSDLENLAGFDATFLAAVTDLIAEIDANAQQSFPMNPVTPRLRQTQISELPEFDSLRSQLLLQPAVQPTSIEWRGRLRNQGQLGLLSDLAGYGLSLMSLNSSDALPQTGKNLVIVAKIGDSYYARIFDISGEIAVGKQLQPDTTLKQELDRVLANPVIAQQTERELIRKMLKQELDRLLANPVIAQQTERELIRKITSSLGNPPRDSEFTAAITDLIRELQEQEIEQPYQLPSRPTDDDLANNELRPELQDKFLIGRFVIRYHGLMTVAEAKQIQDVPNFASIPNQDAIARLYRTSFERGMQGKKLEIQARRGSAIPVSADLREETLTPSPNSTLLTPTP